MKKLFLEANCGRCRHSDRHRRWRISDLSHLRQKLRIARAFAWTGIFSAVAANQYDKNTKDAKEDLVYRLNFYSQGFESPAIDSTLKKMLRMNRVLTEARLSLAESAASNVDLANSYLSTAEEDLKAVGWLDVSKANILQTVKRQTLSPCNTTSQNEEKGNASLRPKPVDELLVTSKPARSNPR